MLYQLALNELILEDDNTDSDDSNKTKDTVFKTMSLSDASGNSPKDEDDEEDFRNNQRGNGRELTGCALYMKHGLLFKKKFRCENPCCEICSEDKLSFRRFASRFRNYGRRNRNCNADYGVER